ncbi:MAG: hypothetical protein WBD31_21975 [Rubripirellula sp.]
MNFRGNGTGLYLTLPEGGRVELRNMRIATPEATAMMTYDEG